ncbi:hypothetical protein [Vibrio parahaemolyticus]|uniref:hypothetical protein n=1 Tax=Vibrio parahaemolyticus TaxID=670 RepID=UPI000AAE2A3C|nr:hypothetical protein [Vibrio parahaemolyticus]EJG0618264.1 hypothetical protein [Vibrio parahaemolyticus]EJG0636486.1 hypothetical protein [Vibrio parahaemolyticus]EJG0686017.1 hypothetical protein [Vibrio parahaemolyticus]EJG0699226.1 hypothetical protein [Vibrio parahaemolyticus]EJG0726536.1 hypothetical protein [Vibrio parahaemolyticus]
MLPNQSTCLTKEQRKELRHIIKLGIPLEINEKGESVPYGSGGKRAVFANGFGSFAYDDLKSIERVIRACFEEVKPSQLKREAALFVRELSDKVVDEKSCMRVHKYMRRMETAK